MKLDPFYLIVDSAQWIERLVPIGVRLVQLRIKDMPDLELRQQILTSQRVCSEHDCRLVINDAWHLAIQTDAAWVHLGQSDLASADRDAIGKAGVRLGVSTHDERELARALAAEPDYVALGPVFETKLKKMPWAPQGLARVEEWKRKVGDLPLVAIGGLNPERAQQVLRAGADSASVVTDVLLHDNPEARVQQWLEATDPWR